jgi:hypothetical protein
MITRDFDAMLAEQAGIRPTFKIGGQEFTLRAKLPYVRWNKLLAIMRDDDTSPDDATEEFFNTVLIKADRERFLELLQKDDDEDDEEAVIGLDQMNSLTDWVMEHFTGKAPSNTGGSSPGANGTGPAPNVVSLGSKKAANA